MCVCVGGCYPPKTASGLGFLRFWDPSVRPVGWWDVGGACLDCWEAKLPPRVQKPWPGLSTSFQGLTPSPKAGIQATPFLDGLAGIRHARNGPSCRSGPQQPVSPGRPPPAAAAFRVVRVAQQRGECPEAAVSSSLPLLLGHPDAQALCCPHLGEDSGPQLASLRCPSH